MPLKKLKKKELYELTSGAGILLGGYMVFVFKNSKGWIPILIALVLFYLVRKK